MALADTLGLVATMARSGLIAPLRPDKYLRIAAAMQRENMAATSGFATARSVARIGPAWSTNSARSHGGRSTSAATHSRRHCRRFPAVNRRRSA